MNENRLKILLANALIALEDICVCNIMQCDLADEIGITQEEYDSIMEVK